MTVLHDEICIHRSCRYALENDLVEAIIGLPTDMFYNTGITTYVWILSNKKPDDRKGTVQLIDASSFWQKMRKSQKITHVISCDEPCIGTMRSTCMVRSMHLWTVIMISIALAGCVTTRHIPPPPATGDASWRVVLPPGTTRYHLALGEVSSGATAIQRVAPIYPPGLLATCPAPVDVEALLIVDQAGKVSEVRIVDEIRTDPDRPQFIDAVRVAARQWQFSPLQIDHWAADANGNSHVVDSETKPFSLAYVFRFECHAGKSSVSTAAAKP